ncbi:MAG: hypothetical protein QW815_06920, partial [Nitrososphaerota archaeon]
MSGEPLPKELLDRALKLFPSTAIALTGCRAQTWSHPVCEYDFIILSKKRGEKRLQVSDKYFDVHFVSTWELDDLLINDKALSLCHSYTIADPDWVLTSTLSKLRSLEAKIIRSVATNRLMTALLELAHLYSALDGGSTLDAAYWLHSAAYSCSDATIVLAGYTPSPSHTFSQMQNLSMKNSCVFKIWSDALNVDLASS